MLAVQDSLHKRRVAMVLGDPFVGTVAAGAGLGLPPLAPAGAGGDVSPDDEQARRAELAGVKRGVLNLMRDKRDTDKRMVYACMKQLLALANDAPEVAGPEGATRSSSSLRAIRSSFFFAAAASFTETALWRLRDFPVASPSSRWEEGGVPKRFRKPRGRPFSQRRAGAQQPRRADPQRRIREEAPFPYPSLEPNILRNRRSMYFLKNSKRSYKLLLQFILTKISYSKKLQSLKNTEI